MIREFIIRLGVIIPAFLLGALLEALLFKPAPIEVTIQPPPEVFMPPVVYITGECGDSRMRFFRDGWDDPYTGHVVINRIETKP